MSFYYGTFSSLLVLSLIRYFCMANAVRSQNFVILSVVLHQPEGALVLGGQLCPRVSKQTPGTTSSGPHRGRSVAAGPQPPGRVIRREWGRHGLN